MKQKRKAQVTVEFIIIAAAVMSILVSMFFIIDFRDNDLQHVKNKLEAKKIAEDIAENINGLIISGYGSQTFTYIPPSLRSNVDITAMIYPDSRMVTVFWDESYLTIPLLTANIIGNISGDDSQNITLLPGKIIFRNHLGEIQITQEGGFEDSCLGNVANWHFDNSFKDTSGNANHLTRTGTVIISSDSKFGLGSAYFDGSTDYLSISNNPSINFAADSAYTIAYWVKINQIPSTSYATVMKDTYSSSYGHTIRFDADFVVNTDSDTSPEQTQDKLFLGKENEWVHIVQTYDSGVICTYVNRYLKGCTSSFSLTQSTGDLYLGSNLGSSYYLKGWLDEVKMWNRSLSSDEIFLDYLNEGCR